MGTDALSFALHAFLTFGTRLLVTLLGSATSIAVVSVATAVFDLTVSRLVLQASHRHVRNLEDVKDAFLNQRGTQSRGQTNHVPKLQRNASCNAAEPRKAAEDESGPH